MGEKNWALGESGAVVVEVSHEATHVASAAVNLLVEREELLWITGEAPQHVTLKLVDPHPPLHFVGWHVWHDYLTNPKTVEVASGVSEDDMISQLICQAVTGAGTQIWKLPSPIPPQHLFVRVKVMETFGPGPTYINNLVLFANDPGNRFRSVRADGDASKSGRGASAGRMSALLKELDEDIRALHPLKTLSPKRNMLLYVPRDPIVVPPLPEEEVLTPPPSANNSRLRQEGEEASHHCKVASSQKPFENVSACTGVLDVPQSFNDRLCALEHAVASLTQTVNHQREDLTMIKRLLLQQATERRRDLEQQVSSTRAKAALHDPECVSRHQVSVDFPEEALRSFVENIVTPKLNKYTKRAEAQTISKLDDFLKDVVSEITRAVDERVQYHVQQVSATSSSYQFRAEGMGTCISHTPPQCVNGTPSAICTDVSAATSYSPPTGTVAPASPAGIFPKTLSSMTNFRSTNGHEPEGVPISIIRGSSGEADASYFRHTSPHR